MNYANDGRGRRPDARAGRDRGASLELPHEAVGTDHGSLGVFQQQWPWWGSMERADGPGEGGREVLPTRCSQVRLGVDAGDGRRPGGAALGLPRCLRRRRTRSPRRCSADPATAGAAEVTAASLESASDGCVLGDRRPPGRWPSRSRRPSGTSTPRTSAPPARHWSSEPHRHRPLRRLRHPGPRRHCRHRRGAHRPALVRPVAGAGQHRHRPADHLVRPHAVPWPSRTATRSSAGQQIGEVGDAWATPPAATCTSRSTRAAGRSTRTASTPAAGSARTSAATSTTRRQMPSVEQAGAFTLATFNVLGHSHTRPGGNKPGWAAQRRAHATQRSSCSTSTPSTSSACRSSSAPKPRSSAASPARPTRCTHRPGDTENSIAWRRDRFELVGADTVAIPYFNGRIRQMPVVRLRDRATSQDSIFINVHNPANTRRFPHQEEQTGPVA